MNKKAKSSRKRMTSRVKWGRGGNGAGQSTATPSLKTPPLGSVIASLVANMFRRKV